MLEVPTPSSPSSPVTPAPSPPQAYSAPEPAFSGTLASFGSLLSDAWSYYKAIFATIFPLLAAALIIGTILPMFSEFLEGGYGALTIGLSILGVLVNLVLLGAVIPLAILAALAQRWEGVTVPLSEILVKVRGLFIPYAVIGILMGLALFGGYILLVIPGIIMSIWLGMSQYVLVVEGRRGFSALLRSMGLVLGSSWGVFWRLTGISIVLAFLGFLLNLPAVGLQFFSVFEVFQEAQEGVSPEEAERLFEESFGQAGIRSAISSLWQGVVQLLLMPFPLAFGFALFQDLKRVKGDSVAEDKRGLLKIFFVIGIIGVVALIGFLLLLAVSFPFLLEGNELPYI